VAIGLGGGFRDGTLAFAVLILLVSPGCGRRRLVPTGLLIGLSLWVRPDGLTLSGPALLVIWFGRRTGVNGCRTAPGCWPVWPADSSLPSV
jgi:hypothetical protein